MSSSAVGLISWKGDLGSSCRIPRRAPNVLDAPTRFISRKWHARPCLVSVSQRKNNLGLMLSSSSYSIVSRKKVGVFAAISAFPRSNSPHGISSPWLMLPPASSEDGGGGGELAYRFYSLEEDSVLSFNKRGGGGGGEESSELDDQLPDDDEVMFVGSSHGWLVLFNKSNCDLFLCDPISRRHVKLPPIKTLPISDYTKKRGLGCVRNVILSSSPDDDRCRAMMIYWGGRLAFCVPGRSLEWTPIGAVYGEDFNGEKYPRSYQTCVYHPRKKLFYCYLKYDFEAWDLRDPSNPRWISIEGTQIDDDGKDYWHYLEDSGAAEIGNDQFLVVPQHSDDLFLVHRYVMPRVGPDGSQVEPVYLGLDKGYETEKDPYKTIGFEVFKYNFKTRTFMHVDSDSLNGLAIFVGANDGFALRADKYPRLKPDSIYFTDKLCSLEWGDQIYGGHDIGVFNYKDRTFSPCYYPCDVESMQKIVPAPMWFTPCTKL